MSIQPENSNEKRSRVLQSVIRCNQHLMGDIELASHQLSGQAKIATVNFIGRYLFLSNGTCCTTDIGHLTGHFPQRNE